MRSSSSSLSMSTSSSRARGREPLSLRDRRGADCDRERERPRFCPREWDRCPCEGERRWCRSREIERERARVRSAPRSRWRATVCTHSAAIRHLSCSWSACPGRDPRCAKSHSRAIRRADDAARPCSSCVAPRRGRWRHQSGRVCLGFGAWHQTWQIWCSWRFPSLRVVCTVTRARGTKGMPDRHR